MANRSNAVVEGGLFSLPRQQISSDTQHLLKTMMQESRLTNFQQRQLSSALKSGGSLPTTCHPTSSAKPRSAPKNKPPSSKVLNPRNYSSHTRKREQIEASGAYDREQFHPLPQVKFNGAYDNDKRRLANVMAYGKDIEPPANNTRPVRVMRQEEEHEDTDRFTESFVKEGKEWHVRPRQAEEIGSTYTLSVILYCWEVLVENEIMERRAFLQEMERYGRGHEYRTIIETEISQMIREMELIDSQRDAELQRAIAATNSSEKASKVDVNTRQSRTTRPLK